MRGCAFAIGRIQSHPGCLVIFQLRLRENSLRTDRIILHDQSNASALSAECADENTVRLDLESLRSKHAIMLLRKSMRIDSGWPKPIHNRLALRLDCKLSRP